MANWLRAVGIFVLSLYWLSCPLKAQPDTHRALLQRADGSNITYYLNRPDSEGYPLVVILQGSECLKVSHKYSRFIDKLVTQGTAVLRIEKPGLDDTVEIGECTDEYLRLNTPQRRVLDLLLVVADLRKQPSWDGRLALVGGSEGAMIAAMAAELLPETGAVVLLSGGGGLPFGEEVLAGVRLQMRQAGAEPAQIEKEIAQMRTAMQKMAADPNPYKEWMSDGKLVRNTHLWWAHAIPLRLTTPLLRLQAPVLILHGRSDLGTPFESAQLLIDELTLAGKDKVEFRAYEGGHSPPPEQIEAALDWVTNQLNRARRRWKVE